MQRTFLNTKSFVFVDAHLEDIQTLSIHFPHEAKISFLNSEENLLTQIATQLKGQTNVAALHLITHGHSGAILLGKNGVSLETLPLYGKELLTISSAMSKEGELFLYGCEIAAGERGVAFVAMLQDVTGLKIAASTHKVGHEELGGSWDLDAAPDMMMANALHVSQWRGVLPVIPDFGTGVTFNGSNQYATMSDTDYSVTTALTMEAWINPASTEGVQHIMGKWTPFGGTQANSYLLAINEGYIGVWLSSDGTLEQSFTSVATVSTSTWAHVALVFDNGTAKLYINGALDTTYTTDPSFTTLSKSTEVFSLGASHTGSTTGYYYNGQMDEARVWTTARSEADIQADMYQTLQGDEIGLAGYWNMDEGSGTTLTDSTTNENTATLIGTPTFTETSIAPIVVTDSDDTSSLVAVMLVPTGDSLTGPSDSDART